MNALETWLAATAEPPPPAAVGGWLPVPLVKAGVGAPRKAERSRGACKLCKQFRGKCDKERPCRRCLYSGRQDECIKSDGSAPTPARAASAKAVTGKLRGSSGVQGGGAASSSSSSGKGKEAVGDKGKEADEVGRHPAMRQRQCDRVAQGPAGEESLEVSTPDLVVRSVSPALARRYGIECVSPLNTNMLLWLQDENHEAVLTAIESAAAMPEAERVTTSLGVVNWLIMRYNFAEIHQCSLAVRAGDSNRVTLHIVWDESVQRWEDAVLAAGGTLPPALARTVQRRLLVHMREVVYRFDDLQSGNCIAAYANAGTQVARFPDYLTRALDNLVSLEESKSKLRMWGGLRSALVAATRMLELSYDLQDEQRAVSGSDAQRCGMPNLTVRLRLRFPQILGGVTTRWLTAVQLVMNGLPGSTLNAKEKFSCCPLLDCSRVDPHSDGATDSSLDLLVLRLRAVDSGHEDALAVTERFHLHYGDSALMCTGQTGETRTSLRFRFVAIRAKEDP